jgi:hypothetical protein
MRRFRLMCRLQELAVIQSRVVNDFGNERRLPGRNLLKQDRAAALADEPPPGGAQ